MTTEKGTLLNKALKMMVDAHEGQKDRGGVPYALHPIAVMQIMNTSDEELMCIALLHDVVEDNKEYTFTMLSEIFTKRIVDAVRLLTKMPGQTAEEYMEGLFTNIDAMKVKMADLCHNSDLKRLKGIRQKDIDRMAKYQVMYYTLQMKVEEWEKKN